MASIYQLNSVVKSVGKADRESGKAEGFYLEYPEGGFWETFGKEKRCYRVARRGRDSGTAKFEFSFDEHAVEKDWRLTVDFKSTVAFVGRTESDARRLVDELRTAENFDLGFEDKIRDWITEFADEQKLSKADFINRFLVPDQIRQLKAHLSERARNQLFLEFLSIELPIHGASIVPEVQNIDLSTLSVSVHDYSRELQLKLQADLHLIKGDILPYVSSLDAETLRDRIREAVQGEFRKNISLHQWQFEMQSTVRNRVFEVIAEVALAAGRIPDRLLIDGAPAIEDVLRQIECDPPISEEFKKPGYPDDIKVSVSGRLVLADLGTLAASPVDPRGVLAWMHQMVTDTANAILLNDPYVALFDTYESKKARVLKALIDAAAGIGYDLCDARMRTNLDFEILRDGIVFIPPKELTKFSLAVQECEVVLGIEIRMHIEDREALGRLFESKVGVVEKIFNIIKEAVSSELRDIFPDEFYQNFHGSRNKRTAVEARLSEAAKKACIKKLGLKQTFDFEVDQEKVAGFDMTIKFKVQPDELWGLFTQLSHHAIPFEGLRDHNTGIVVDALCAVVSIPPKHWLKFFHMKPKPELVEQHVRNHVLSYLNDQAQVHGVNSLVNTLDSVIRTDVQTWVNERLGQSLGVNVAFQHWLRQSAESGQPLDDINFRIQKARQARLDLVEKLRSEYIQGDPSEIQETKDRIAAVERDIEELTRQSGTRSMIRPESDFHLIEDSAKKRRELAAPKDEDTVQ